MPSFPNTTEPLRRHRPRSPEPDRPPRFPSGAQTRTTLLSFLKTPQSLPGQRGQSQEAGGRSQTSQEPRLRTRRSQNQPGRASRQPDQADRKELARSLFTTVTPCWEQHVCAANRRNSETHPGSRDLRSCTLQPSRTRRHVPGPGTERRPRPLVPCVIPSLNTL